MAGTVEITVLVRSSACRATSSSRTTAEKAWAANRATNNNTKCSILQSVIAVYLQARTCKYPTQIFLTLVPNDPNESVLQ